MQHIQKVRLEPGEVITSHDVKALFTSVPVDPSIPSISPLLPTCLWKGLKSKPLALPLTPHLWLRFGDDTFVIQMAEHSQQFLPHIKTQDPKIQFTMEEPSPDGSLLFLDTKVT